MDFGTVIYDQIMRHVDSFVVQLSIFFPCLICGFLVSQNLNILTSKDAVGHFSNLLDFNFNFYNSNHVADLCAPKAEFEDAPAGDEVVMNDIHSRNRSLIWKTLKKASYFLELLSSNLVRLKLMWTIC